MTLKQKISSSISLSLSTIFFATKSILAGVDPATDISTVFKPAAKIGDGNTQGILAKFLSPLIQNLSLLFIGLALISVVYGGVKFITTHGDPKGTQQARNMITYALVGLALAALAYWITKIVFTVAGLGNLF